jgi:hypothetical protein
VEKSGHATVLLGACSKIQPKKVTFSSGQNPQGVVQSARWEISERSETEIDPEQDGF